MTVGFGLLIIGLLTIAYGFSRTGSGLRIQGGAFCFIGGLMFGAGFVRLVLLK